MNPGIVKGVVILLIAGMSGCTFLESPEESPDYDVAPEVKWLQENAVPFKTAEPGSSYEDLMLLKEIIGNARIVALGEATHGTSEFFTMKHRIVEFLVNEMGFTIFVIEASWPESYLVNTYVHTGEGDPADFYIQPATLLAPTNVGFENGISGWALTGLSRQDYEISTSTVVVYSGSTSGYITSAREEIEDFGTLRQFFRADEYRGKRVRLSAYVKTKGIIEWAGLWMRVDSPYRPVGIDNMSDRPIQGDTDWTLYEIVLDVPEDCVNIGFGILIVGPGEVWVDDFEFEIVGYDVPVTGVTYQ